jgi:transaldolase
MKQNPLLKLQTLGQSIWMDYISRDMIVSGELERLIREDGLSGVTSNPSIFEKAVLASDIYEEVIRSLSHEGRRVEEIYEIITTQDVGDTADLFRPIYDNSKGWDGFVSLEVNPHLARDAEGTVAEARRLWALLKRPNVLIKVPATVEGLKAIRQLISEGINVNVTLLFGLPRYRKVAEAYIAGLSDRSAKNEPIGRVVSVASFFLSRIDVLVDSLLEKKMDVSGIEAEKAKKLQGRIAIASAKEAYQIYKGIFRSEQFKRLNNRGGRPQRVLWASTSTKNPDYSDTKYVEPLIGPETINTLPLETLNAYREHGSPAPLLEEGVEEARQMLRSLPELMIDIEKVTQQLEDEGIEKFNKPYDSLLAALKQKQDEALGGSRH